MASTEDASLAVEPTVPAGPRPETKTNVPPKRPLTGAKPVPSKTSTFMNPTSTTAARSTVGSTLNKPPARPTSTTATKKAVPGTAGTAGTHRSQPSLASIEESNKSGASGDEKKTSEIGKPAKRMSLAGGAVGRTPATKAMSAAHDRRSTIQPSSPSERKPVARGSTLSPTKSRAPASPASRTTTTTTPRTSTRPLTSSARTAGVADGKKRLSTIPASPAVKAEPSEDDKESAKPSRPALGARQSTPSMVLQQRIREFELVNEMLQAAMTAENVGDEEKQGQLENQVAGSMAKLKRDLEKVRAFEEQHGRIPTEAELSAEAETGRELAVAAAPFPKEATEDSAKLKAELEQSQAEVQVLKKVVEEMQLKMAEFGLAAESEASNVQIAKENLEKKIVELETRERALLEQAPKDLEEAKVEAARVATDAIRAEQTAQMDTLVASHSKEVADLVKQLEQAEAQKQSRDQQASKDLEDARTAYQRQIDNGDREIAGQNNVIKSLQDELERLKHSQDDLEAAVKSKAEEAQNLGCVVERLQNELRSTQEASTKEHNAQLEKIKEHEGVVVNLKSVQASKEHEIEKLGAVIGQLQNEIQLIRDAKTHEKDAEIQKLIGDHESVFSKLTAAQQAKEQEIERLGTVVERLQNEVQSVHDARMDENEAQLQKFKEERDDALSKLNSRHQGELQSQKSAMEGEHKAHISHIVEEHQQELDALTQRHARELRTHQEAAKTTTAELEKVQAAARGSDVLVEKLQAETEASQEAAAQAKSALKSTLADLEAARSQVTSLQQALETLDRESASKDEHHASLLKKAKADAEEAARVVSEADKSELALKHETVINTLRAQHDEALSKVRADIERESTQHAKELQAKRDELDKAEHLQAQLEDRVRKSDAAKDEVERRLQSELSQAQEDARESRKLAEELQAEVTKAQEESEELRKLTAELQVKIAKAHEDAEESSKAAEELRAQATSAQKEAKESSKLAEELRAEVAKAQEGAQQSSKLAEELRADIAKAQEEAKESSKLAEELRADVAKAQEETKESGKLAEELRAEVAKAQEEAKESSKLAEELQAKVAKAQEEAKESSKLAEGLRAEAVKAQEEAKESSKLAEELQAKVAEVQEEAKESSKLAEELRAEVAKAQEEAKDSSKLAEELQAKVSKAEENAKESSKLVEELQIKVGKDQESILKLTAAAEDASKAIESSNKGVLKQADKPGNRELATLKQQLDGALQEVETQRALNDKAEEAAEKSKIKIRELEASLKVTTAELTEAKKAQANGVDILRGPTGKAIVGNGSPGLEDSKWATEESPPLEKTDGEDRGAALQGSMAGIQEQIRQLGEINDDFLEDHARMARTLSNVPPPDSPVDTTPSQSPPATSDTAK